jgi:DNA-binding NarL/FixJ family response regulator
VTRAKEPSSSPSDRACTFRLTHEGREFLVLSEPLRPAPTKVLSPAELDVARAIVRGASNAQIARARGTSVRTVAKQVASILSRLGVTSRTQVAAKLALVDFGEAAAERGGRR